MPCLPRCCLFGHATVLPNSITNGSVRTAYALHTLLKWNRIVHLKDSVQFSQGARQFWFALAKQLHTDCIYLIQFLMENFELSEVVKKFDNFVQSSLTRKDDSAFPCPPADCRVQNYLTEMEKRLKLKPRSQEQRFETLLKPMKDLKSFVSVREFMESLGNFAAGKVGRTGDRGGQAGKSSKDVLKVSGYLQRAEQHLRNKKFKRSARSPPLYLTELEDHSLESSEYRTWVENALDKSTSKNLNLFRKTESRLSQEAPQQRAVTETIQEGDCLIQQHQKEYAEQFKVVPHMRELCTQEYENFAKISSLLTGRLRKILQNNCAGRNSTNIKNPVFVDSFDKKDNRDSRQTVQEKIGEQKTLGEVEEKLKKLGGGGGKLKKSHIRKTTCLRDSKENPTNQKTQKKRVQTAGTRRRDDGWREKVTSKLRCIINDGET